ncbi:hypothetical protein WBG78_00645 [Chryseolinea sp. T2]|uniref:hypothetical protein n=1 Tax=Chryseolinea sp. T2 TaxID=3129255 RepID=UPI0030779C4B
MLKFLVIFGLFLYAVYKVGSLFFRAGAASQALKEQERRNFHANNPPKGKKGRNNKAGEYIDYEEVK